jgi:P-type Mg2+ transporter
MISTGSSAACERGCVLLTTAIMAVGIAIPFSALGAAVGLQPLPIAYFPWLAGILLT